MTKKKNNKEALSVSRLITDILINQLNIPSNHIVNDASFPIFTGLKRPDLLISNIPYDIEKQNDAEYIENLLCYAESKDISCIVGDSDWQDAFNQGKIKAPKIKMPFFAVTNYHTTQFYNTKTGENIKINGNRITEFQTLDILRIIKKRLTENPDLNNIQIGFDSLAAVSEAVFNKKLWDLREIYREIDFINGAQKIDFTIGLIALEYYDEKSKADGSYNENLDFWTNAKQYSTEERYCNNLRTHMCSYIDRLMEPSSNFSEFSQLLEVVKNLISGNNAIIKPSQLQKIYKIIDSMSPLHGAGFDLFGAVYENFANSKEKKDFGEYFTRRHYAHVLAELLLKDEFSYNKKIKILDPACGTGGMLTESFKVLRNNFEQSGSFTDDASRFLSEECFYGIDIRSENITRTRLNMFLVGDGHTNMQADNTLNPDTITGKKFLENNQYDYIITNPPYGSGTIRANTDRVGSNRMEIAFICKIIDLLKIGGNACIITPDGVLENPNFHKFREELLETTKINAIISLPKYAFAPYTKEKTYAIFLTKRHNRNYVTNSINNNKPTGRIQNDPIWMYIIDNDGFANSDKRFPTRLRDDNQGWLHDEVSGYSDNFGNECKSIIEERWLRYDDKLSNGTEWINEKGENKRQRKGGWISMKEISNSGSMSLLPEQYFRPYLPHYITLEQLEIELNKL